MMPYYMQRVEDVYLQYNTIKYQESERFCIIIYDRFLTEPRQLRWHTIDELPKDGYGAHYNKPPRIGMIYNYPTKPPHLYIQESLREEAVAWFRQFLFDRHIS